MKKNVMVIVNPKAGQGKGLKKWVSIKEFWQNQLKFQDFEVRMTTKTGEATELTREAIKNGFCLVIVVGGDGTINEAINGFFENGKLISENAHLGIITSGTGCDFVKSLPTYALTGLMAGKMPFFIKMVLEKIEKGDVLKIDIGEITYLNFDGKKEKRYFVNIADVGVAARVSDEVNKTKKKNSLSYLIKSLTTLFTYKPEFILLKGRKKNKTSWHWRGKTLNVSIANGRYFGKGMLVAPLAQLDDGLFDIVIMGDFKRFEALKGFSKIYKGAHLQLPKVTLARASELEVLTDSQNLLVEAEGEVIGKAPVHFKIHPQILKIACWD